MATFTHVSEAENFHQVVFPGIEPKDLVAIGRRDLTVPGQVFLLSEAARKKVAKETDGNEVLRLCLKDAENAPNPNFSPRGPNLLNAAYYSAKSFETRSGSITGHRYHTMALAEAIAGNFPDRDTLKIQELSAGQMTHRWGRFAAFLPNLKIDVDVTDFEGGLPSEKQLQAANSASENLQVRSEAYNIFEDMPPLPESERKDVMIIHYGFDSVWGEEDVRLVKIMDRWFRYTYRPKVKADSPYYSELMDTLKNHPDQHDLPGKAFMDVVLEEAVEEVDINDIPFGRHIAASTLGYPVEEMSVPGMAAKKIVQAFESRLKDDGVFIITDTGWTEEKMDGQTSAWKHPPLRTGDGGVFRGSDRWDILKRILEDEYGLEVAVEAGHDFNKRALHGKVDVDEIEAYEKEQAEKKKRKEPHVLLDGNYVITVRKKQK